MSNRVNNLYEFDEYLLNVEERSLWKEDKLLKIPPKVFDTLKILVENRGEVLSKESLMNAVWEEAFVEESNLSQNIYTLRQLFGSDKKYIKTVPKQGYVFDASVKHSSIEKAEITQETGNGNSIVATQTRTRIIEEGFVEDDFRTLSPATTNWRAVLGVGLAVLLTSAIGFFAYTSYSSRENTKRKIPTASFDYVELTDTGGIGSSTISPDGKFVAFVKDGINLMEVESGKSVKVEIDGETRPGFLRFSSDGKSIFFRTSGKPKQFASVYKVGILGGEPELIVKDIWGLFSLSHDDKRMTFFSRNTAGSRNSVVVRDIETGVEQRIIEYPATKELAPAAYPVFSPDDKKVAFLKTEGKEEQTNLYVVNSDGSGEEKIAVEFSHIRQVVWGPDGRSFFLNAKEVGKQYQIWNVSYPGAEVARVTSDSNAYRSLDISEDGSKLSGNRLVMHSNIWFYPDANPDEGERLTVGENGISGLLTTRFMPNGKIFYSNRDGTSDGILLIDRDGGSRRRFSKEDLRLEQEFRFSAFTGKVYFERKRTIWISDFDGGNMKPLDLGDADVISQPAVSLDGKKLYYVKRSEDDAAIWSKELPEGANELVVEADGYSPDTFLSVSPDERYLAFVYVDKKKVGDEKSPSSNMRKYGFLDLKNDNAVKVIELPAYRSILRWADGGKSFYFPKFVKGGSAIFKQSVEGDGNRENVFELKGDIIYRFDWSPDGKDLVIARGNYKMDLVLLNNSG